MPAALRRDARTHLRAAGSLAATGLLLVLSVLPADRSRAVEVPPSPAATESADPGRIVPTTEPTPETAPAAADRLPFDLRWALVGFGMAAIAAAPSAVLHRRDRPPRSRD